ncbi:MAG: hypothetical protein RMJ87_03670 [Cytophagales bacterium]|nr:hypothetical protein [Bernardetiaceae bacterium]MDW8204105.1 hypothetical protein [Cytophagales bacterium]
MLLLLLSALCSAALMLVFKAFEKWKVNIWQGVTFNYFACVLTGSFTFVLQGTSSAYNLSNLSDWLYPAAFLGLLFFTGFSLSGFSAQKAGVTITTLAAKMSLIVPVLFNLWWMPDNRLSATTYAGIVLTFPALWLASAKRSTVQLHHQQRTTVATTLLPVAVFVAGGMVDTTVNWANSRLQHEWQQAVFAIASFGAAGICGLAVLIFRMITYREYLTWRSVAGGVALGVPNYFSIYLLLQALSAFNNNGAWLFPLYNILIILVASAGSVLLFGERLSFINLIGMTIAIIALTLLAG